MLWYHPVQLELRSKLICSPFSAAYADFVLSMINIYRGLRVVSICGIYLHQSWIGYLGSMVARVTIVWYLADITAGSAVLTRQLCSSAIWMSVLWN